MMYWRRVLSIVAGIAGISGCASNESDDTEREGSPTLTPTATEAPTPTAAETPTETPTPTATPVPPDSENARLEFDQSEPIELPVDEPVVSGATTNITPGESVECEIRGGPIFVSTRAAIAEDGRVEWEFDLALNQKVQKLQ